MSYVSSSSSFDLCFPVIGLTLIAVCVVLRENWRQNYAKQIVPGREIIPSFVLRVEFLRSRIKLGLSFVLLLTLCTPTKRGQIEPSGVFSADAINPVDRCGRQTFPALVTVIPKWITLPGRVFSGWRVYFCSWSESKHSKVHQITLRDHGGCCVSHCCSSLITSCGSSNIYYMVGNRQWEGYEQISRVACENISENADAKKRYTA